MSAQPIEAVWTARRARRTRRVFRKPATSYAWGTGLDDWHGYWRNRTFLDGEWGILGHLDRSPPPRPSGYRNARAPRRGSLRASARIRSALLGLSLAISLACAHGTASAEFDRQGRITDCEVATYELARVLEAECSKHAVKIAHKRESGWAGRAISAIGGWLAGKAGL